jgi:hypothetical protein
MFVSSAFANLALETSECVFQRLAFLAAELLPFSLPSKPAR